MQPAPITPRSFAPVGLIGALLSRHGWKILRLSLAALMVLILGGFVIGLPRHYEQHVTLTYPGLTDAAAVQASLARLGLSLAGYAAAAVAFEAVVAAIFVAVALVILWRRSDEPAALFVALFLIGFGTQAPLSAVGEAHPGHPIWAFLSLLAPLLGWGLLLPFLYLFPDGRLVPRWIWPLLLVYAVEIACWLSPRDSPFYPQNWPSLLFLLVVAGLLASGVVAQIYRYRRHSTPTQRQQTKWVVVGAIAMLIVQLLLDAFSTLLDVNFLLDDGPLESLAFLFLPLSIGLAILRYRLWAIDLLINRALVYGLLTGALLLVYLGGVVLLQGLFRAVTGQESNLAIVVSTLAAAALFQPLRRRLQAFIDRRFYRSKYDAARTLGAFSARLRDEVDLTAVTDGLLDSIQETMQPAHISLWLPSRSGAPPYLPGHAAERHAGGGSRRGAP